MTLNESWESMHAEGALPVINKPQAHKPFHLLSIYLYLLCPEGTWGVLKELYFDIRSQQMGIVDVICPFYWFQHKYTCTLKRIVHPKIIIILSLFAYPRVVTDLYAFFSSETQNVYFFEKYSGPLFQYNRRE